MAWEPEPLVRGTFSILSTCLLTLFLCVWTAMHLNIPKRENVGNQFWQKVLWLLIATFAPEWVTLVAYSQFKEAQEVDCFMRKALSQPEHRPWWRRLFSRATIHATLDTKPGHGLGHSESLIDNQLKSREWTPTHSMYAIMGGFAIQFDETYWPCIPRSERQLRLTVSGLRLVAETVPEAIPALSESKILDQSKGDGFTKALACIQATWFCIGLISRRVDNLSISLLELNTAAHAICALLIYLVFWWDKPLDVQYPVVIVADKLPKVSAFIALSHSRSGLQWSAEDYRQELDLHPNENGKIKLIPGQSYCGFKHQFRGATLGAAERRIWAVANEFLLETGVECLTRSWVPYKKFARTHINNAPREERILGQDYFTSALNIGVIAAGLFYGGFHLLAWNRQFRKQTEAVLWKASGLYLAASGLLAVVGDMAHKQRKSHRVRGFKTLFKWTIYAIGMVAFIVYVACRVYIVVECFLDLSHLPESAFRVPQWTQYLPHLG